MLTLAITGHRPEGLHGSYRPITWMPAVEFLRERFTHLADWHGQIQIVQGMAAGFDMMAAAAALMARDRGAPVRLVAVMPWACHYEMFDKLPEVQRWSFRICERADELVSLFSERPQDRRHAAILLKERNLYMVNRAKDARGEVLACWSGKPRSGTAHTVAYAERQGVPVDNIYADVMAELVGKMAL